jgi:hypothetical protein
MEWLYRQLGITSSGESSGVAPTVLGNSTLSVTLLLRPLGLNFHIEAEFDFSFFLYSLNTLGNIRYMIALVPRIYIKSS